MQVGAGCVTAFLSVPLSSFLFFFGGVFSSFLLVEMPFSGGFPSSGSCGGTGSRRGGSAPVGMLGSPRRRLATGCGSQEEMPGHDWPKPPRCPSLPQGGGVRRSLGVPTPPHLSVWSLSSSAPAFSSGGPWLASAAPPLFCSPSAGLAFASSLGGSSLPAAFSPSCPSASLGRLGESWGGGKGRAQLSSALQPPPPDPGHPPRYLQGVLSFPLARGALLVLLVDHQLPLLVAAPLRAALLLAVALRLPRRLLGAALLLGGLRGAGGTRLGGRLEALGPPHTPRRSRPTW